jgi:nucleotide-binding universal stress UspA family protein
MHATRHYVDRVVADLPRGLRARGIALDGPVATALTEAARSERLDLLVLGSRRVGPAMRVVLGGVSSQLATHRVRC